MPKLSKALSKRYGQLSWYNQLLKAGRIEEANKWANRYMLHVPHPSDPRSCIQGNAAAKPPTATANATEPSDPLPAATIAALSSQPSVQGTDAARVARSARGAGVGENGLAQNLDRTAPRGENLQLALAKAAVARAAVVGDAADAALPASPSGEVEGNKESCQADKGGLFSNRLESGWVVSGEGVVGGNCRNRWFVEVSVDGKWAKAAVGEVSVRRGTRVRVRLEWVSADGRDAEYAIVEALPDLAEPVQAKPVGPAVNRVEPQMPVKAKETAFPTFPAQSMGMFQTGVQTVHDQPKEVVFQTTTMEKLVEAEKVGVMHSSGKSGLIPAPDTDFRSPVLDDVSHMIPIEEVPLQPEMAKAIEQAIETPAGVEGLGDYDFMERARMEAIKAYSSGQPS